MSYPTNKKRSKISEQNTKQFNWNNLVAIGGLIIAGIPSLGYYVHFIVNSIKFEFYEIPKSLISFHPQDVLTTSALSFLFIVFLFSIFLVAYYAIAIILKRIRVYIEIVFFILLIAIFYSGMLVFMESISVKILITVAIGIMLVAVGLVLVNKKTINEKVVLPFTKTLQNDFGISPANFTHKLVWTLRIFEGFLFITFIICLLGVAQIITTNDYYIVTVDQKEYVALYTTSDYFVCAPFDRSTGLITPIYRVVEVLNNPDLLVQYDDLGSLKIKPSPRPTPIPTSTPTVTPVPTITNIPTATTQK